MTCTDYATQIEYLRKGAQGTYNSVSGRELEKTGNQWVSQSMSDTRPGIGNIQEKAVFPGVLLT